MPRSRKETDDRHNLEKKLIKKPEPEEEAGEKKKKSKRDGIKNLIPMNKRPHEEVVEITKRAAQASVIARRKKAERVKTFRELANEIFSLKNDDPKIAEIFEKYGIDPETNEHAGKIMIAAIKGAEKGNKYDRDFVKGLVDGEDKQVIDLNIGAQEDTDVLIYLPKNPRDEGLDLGQTEEKQRKKTTKKPGKNEP